ncbi:MULTISPECIES: fructose-specific PTS transporter subunit EIIC [unclassified Frondihabitans]|uniref:PTS fructose transporter subunit IIABC n=1 Tax=unclassified Frondihabitans TaxID=2626248 RepID=UPI000F4FDE13|nr:MULTISPECIES: fructose-specific PTS transporter subunit EIIC [unclassified Frondihabitans]RPE78721.1 PTS system D-fructose-specific IIA component (F1P-forming) (Frc family) /PTS system D-fructose-specific IIB component (F1P-forming) (Frc family) /PTS system D-fructose-specific IIC component (F1P-forming) (Frc family) [Frondihabitans sp. PhB153]RPF09002.1 PTS system D-fructose-specific IIA component (F1P-forming) (Frc family) /PTS system D-fructose-specific IIB component (F1P-forming) (Frc fami
MSTLINTKLVGLDENLGETSSDVIRALAARVAADGRAGSAESLADDAIKREASVGTGVPGGIAIPHARSSSVSEPTLAMSRLARKVPFGAPDGDADIVFMIAVPEGADADHMTVLSTLARALIRDDFTAALRAAATPADVVALVDAEVGGEVDAARGVTGTTAPAAGSAGQNSGSDSGHRVKLVGVTACPTGIAHTYMAADALVAAAKRLGADLQIETQGSGRVTPLDPAVIEAADAVIFAVDVDVRDRGRFAGKPLVQGPVKRGVDEPTAMVEEAIAASTDPRAARVTGSVASGPAMAQGRRGFGSSLKTWLLTGVSYMIPFVAGGGLLIALGFLLSGFGIALTADGHTVNNAVYALQNYSLANLPPEGLWYYLGAAAFQIGGASMGFLVAALAGYIAYAIADRPGIAPGFVAGAIAVFMNAGFLGGLVGGLLAGAAAYYIGKLDVPRFVRGLMPVVIIPLFASIFASGLMLLFLGGPIASLMKALTDFLNGLSGSGAILLGVILGLMMCFDLGGPVNKVAYAFAVAGLSAGSVDNPAPWMIMAAVMGAGMVPPLAMALASTVLYRKGFSQVERTNGGAAWLLGASFISEGAIPFAAADPLRVIPASMVGGAVTGAISMAAGVTSQAPHGGFFVFFAIGNLLMWTVAILSGTVVTAVVLVALKRFVRRRPVGADEKEAASAAAVVDQREPVAV